MGLTSLLPGVVGPLLGFFYYYFWLSASGAVAGQVFERGLLPWRLKVSVSGFDLRDQSIADLVGGNIVK